MIRRTVLRRLTKLEKEMMPAEPFIINVEFIDAVTGEADGKGFQVVIPAGRPRRPNLPERSQNRSRE
jgi:hypothetical protein